MVSKSPSRSMKQQSQGISSQRAGSDRCWCPVPFLFSLRPQPMRKTHHYSWWVFPPPLNLSGNTIKFILCQSATPRCGAYPGGWSVPSETPSQSNFSLFEQGSIVDSFFLKAESPYLLLPPSPVVSGRHYFLAVNHHLRLLQIYDVLFCVAP